VCNVPTNPTHGTFGTLSNLTALTRLVDDSGENTTYRQQSLDNLTDTSQTQGAHGKRKLEDLAPRCFQYPIKREGNEEKCNKVQDFVGLLVGWDFVVGR
jgi:hypothetical protein